MGIIPKGVALVTGAASGMGLSLTKHLLARGWRVAMADLNIERGTALANELGPNVFFQQTDISNFTQQSALFRKAFKWGGNRIDLLAANAGIDDAQSLYELPKDIDAEPQELNLKTLRVDLDAVFQGIWLFRHYARRSENKGGKIVITSSAAGLYPMDTNPQYTAAKHALVGLTRACGPMLTQDENITVNCILPAFVPTGLAPPGLIDIFPKEHITPMSTVMKAYDTFMADDEMTGQTVELSQGQLFFREKADYPNESQRWIGEESKKFWDEAYPSTREA